MSEPIENGTADPGVSETAARKRDEHGRTESGVSATAAREPSEHGTIDWRFSATPETGFSGATDGRRFGGVGVLSRTMGDAGWRRFEGGGEGEKSSRESGEVAARASWKRLRRAGGEAAAAVSSSSGSEGTSTTAT